MTLTACHRSAASGVELQTKVREDFTITEKAQLREVMMGEGNGVASVIMLTFTKMPGLHADTAWAVVG